MYVRKKTVKGTGYYQIVRGVRDGDRVRQEVVLALGTTPDPAEALKGMKRKLARLRRERNRWPAAYLSGSSGSRTLDRRIERLGVMIAGMESRVETLAGLIKSKSIGTTPKRKED